MMKPKRIAGTACLAMILCLSLSPSANAEEVQQSGKKLFQGVYAGLELGFQRVYSGALIDDLDILQDDSRAVVSLLAGWRWQFDNGLVLGVEGQFGLFDGGLQFVEPARNLTINYDSTSQTAAGLTLGYVFGSQEDWLVFGYGIATLRDFDLNINLDGFQFTQTDGQGVMRYGLGVEKQSQSGWGFRVSVGSNYTDFGDLVTNTNVNGKFEASAGVVYQF